jgi:RNA polymerase sigma-70 factor, ECF subfamily
MRSGDVCTGGMNRHKNRLVRAAAPEDGGLVTALRNGDATAFERLTRLHAPALRGLLRSLGAGREDAEDILQETWIAAHRGLPGFRGESSLRSWLGRIATNGYRDLIRVTRRLLVSEEVDPHVENAHPADRLARREKLTRVLAAVRELPPRQRETLLLRVGENLSYAEIAERLGVGRDAVRMNLIEARRKLMRRFGENGGTT